MPFEYQREDELEELEAGSEYDEAEEEEMDEDHGTLDPLAVPPEPPAAVVPAPALAVGCDYGNPEEQDRAAGIGKAVSGVAVARTSAGN